MRTGLTHARPLSATRTRSSKRRKTKKLPQRLRLSARCTTTRCPRVERDVLGRKPTYRSGKWHSLVRGWAFSTTVRHGARFSAALDAVLTQSRSPLRHSFRNARRRVPAVHRQRSSTSRHRSIPLRPSQATPRRHSSHEYRSGRLRSFERLGQGAQGYGRDCLY